MSKSNNYCSMESCSRVVRCRGLCRNHYASARYHKAIKNVQTKEYHGLSDIGAYKSWEKMKKRCRDKNGDSYRHYGGRGIKVCERWLHSFSNFYADMGDRPAGHTLDRIDVNGNYEPSNCKWSSHQEQVINRRASAGRTCIYTGVSLHRITGKYRARTTIDGKLYYLGLFDDEEEAARSIIALRCANPVVIAGAN